VFIAIQTGVLVFLFPLFLANRGHIGPRLVGVVVSLSVLGRLVALGVGGGLSDRWGRMRVLVRGLIAYAALLGSMAFVTDRILLGLWSFAIGAAAGVVAALPTAVIGDQVPPSLQGVAIGWLRTMMDGGQILGPLVMGALADAVDLAAPFVFGALLLVVTAWRCLHRGRRTAAAPAAGGGDR
jgi:MFS family permease